MILERVMGIEPRFESWGDLRREPPTQVSNSAVRETGPRESKEAILGG